MSSRFRCDFDGSLFGGLFSVCFIRHSSVNKSRNVYKISKCENNRVGVIVNTSVYQKYVYSTSNI